MGVQSLSKLKEVKRLDSLVKAHVLLAVMGDKAVPECRLNVLRAHTFVLRIWQVWMDLDMFFFSTTKQIFFAVLLCFSAIVRCLCLRCQWKCAIKFLLK